MILRFGESGPDVATMQRKLISLGWRHLASDGVFGPQTRSAVTAMQWACTWQRLDVDGVWGPSSDAMADLMIDNGGMCSENFRLTEFANRPKVSWDIADIRVDRLLVVRLELVRAHLSAREGRDVGTYVASGLRTDIRNEQVGGVPTSTHRLGKAVDVLSQVLMIDGATVRALGHDGGIGTVDRTSSGRHGWWTNPLRHIDTGGERSWRYGENGRGNSGGGAYNRPRDRVPVPRDAFNEALDAIEPETFDLREMLYDRIGHT